MQIRIHKIIPRSYVDGPGCRTVVFFQGCTLACPGCQNKHIWPADGGKLVEVSDLAETLANLAGNSKAVTVSGGDPMHQPQALAELVSRLWRFGITNIIVYTGYTWEELTAPDHLAAPWIDVVFRSIDTLVDGSYVREFDDPMLGWRGSRNQRPINVQASLKSGHPVVLDWDSPQLIVSQTGEVLLPVGLAAIFSGLGAPAPTRMCGQTRGQL